MAYSRYFRYKLSDSQKRLYDELLLGMEERKPEVHSGSCYPEDIQKVIYALNFDNPHLYYVDFRGFRIMRSMVSSTFHITYYCDVDTQKTIDEKIKKVAKSIIRSLIGHRMKKAALELHDWLVTRCTYGACEQFPNAAHSIVGPLLYSTCVCEGYAKAYKYLADIIKMRCTLVIGDAIHPDGTRGRHAWNIIRLKDNFYHVDVTFDLLFAKRYCSRAYFLLSTKEILYDHSIEDLFEFPICTESGSILKVISGTSELLQFLESEYQKRVSHSEVRLTKGFSKEKLMSMIINKLSSKDLVWYSQIKTYWYSDFCRTLFLCWR